MERSNRETRLTPEEQKLKERLVRSEEPSDEIKWGSGGVPEGFWEMSRPKITNGSLLEALLRDRDEAR